MAKVEAMKQIAFAQHLGVARSYITQLKQQGRLVMTERGLVDVEASIIRIQETADPNRDDVAARHAKERGAVTAVAAAAEKTEKPAKQKREKDPSGITFSSERALEKRMDRLLKELAYEEKIKKLVPADEVSHAVESAFSDYRQSMENFKVRLAADLVMKDYDYILSAISREVRDILLGLHRSCDEVLKSIREDE